MISLDTCIKFTSCMLLLVYNKKIVAVGGGDCDNVGYWFLVPFCVDFLGIECCIPFLLDCSSLSIDNDVRADFVAGARLTAPLLCFDYWGDAM